MNKNFSLGLVVVLIIVVASFAIIDFNEESESSSVLPELAPVGCTNRYDTSTACFNLAICRRTTAGATTYSEPNFDGSCPKGFSAYTVATQNIGAMCTIAASMASNNDLAGPPACAAGCTDLGVSDYEDRSTTLCCTAGKERTCEYVPDKGSTGDGSKDSPKKG